MNKKHEPKVTTDVAEEITNHAENIQSFLDRYAPATDNSTIDTLVEFSDWDNSQGDAFNNKLVPEDIDFNN